MKGILLDHPSTPQISVIVASCCRPPGLAQLLAALTTQTGVNCAQFECIVAWYGADESQRNCYRQMLDNQEFRIVAVELRQPSGPGVFRNHAMARAVSPLFFCIDDDCIPAADCLAECLQYSEKFPEISAWGGVTETGRGTDAFRSGHQVAAWLDETWREPKTDSSGRVCFIPGLHFLIRRSAYLQAGGFPREFAMVGEDSALCLEMTRRKITMGFNPRQVIRHYPGSGIAGLAIRIFNYGRANGRLRKAYRDVYPAWSVTRTLNAYRTLPGHGIMPGIVHNIRNFLYHCGQLLEILR